MDSTTGTMRLEVTLVIEKASKGNQWALPKSHKTKLFHKTRQCNGQKKLFTTCGLFTHEVCCICVINDHQRCLVTSSQVRPSENEPCIQHRENRRRQLPTYALLSSPLSHEINFCENSITFTYTRFLHPAP